MVPLEIALVDVLLPIHHTTRYRATVKRAYPSKAFKSNSACSAVMVPDSTIFRMRNCSSTVDCGGVGGMNGRGEAGGAGGRIEAGACGETGRVGRTGLGP